MELDEITENFWTFLAVYKGSLEQVVFVLIGFLLCCFLFVCFWFLFLLFSTPSVKLDVSITLLFPTK